MKRIVLTLLLLLSLSGTLFSQEPFIGEIKLFAGSYAPRNWMNCEGQLLPIAQYNVLYAVLGITYGGDGISNFALPDLRGRVPVGQGYLPGGTRPYYQGYKGGRERAILDYANMPEHNHNVKVDVNVDVAVKIPVNSTESGAQVPTDLYLGKSSSSETYTDSKTAGSYLADPEVTTTDTAIVTEHVAGGGEPFDVLQPYQVIRYIICVDGMFPPRN